MATALITGSAGLVGSAVSRHFAAAGFNVHGIDNNGREDYFGPLGSVAENLRNLRRELGSTYSHHCLDITDPEGLRSLVRSLAPELSVVVHAAAQPSHDWAANHVIRDFTVNAAATVCLLEACKEFAPELTFFYLSTNRVYGDTVNNLGFQETRTRYELPAGSALFAGISEDFSIDKTMRSMMGASKAAADIFAQEFGSYFGMRTIVLRCGTITGSAHAGVQEHGFLSHLVKTILANRPYEVLGYGGKQVRDVIAAEDLACAVLSLFEAKLENSSHIFNVGGGRKNSISVLEAISAISKCIDRDARVVFNPRARRGDHKWWITNAAKLQATIPGWRIKSGLDDIIHDLVDHENGGSAVRRG